MQSNTTNTNKTSIICKVKKVVYHNQSNGYSVLSAFSDTEDAPFSICGILNGKPEGTELHCQGEWKNHLMYGRQFIVDSWEEGKADEVKKIFGIQSRAKSSLVYRTWGDFLKHNPDVAEKVKYVTEFFSQTLKKILVMWIIVMVFVIYPLLHKQKLYTMQCMMTKRLVS